MLSLPKSNPQLSQFRAIDFKILLQTDRLVLKLYGPSRHFFEAFDPKTDSSLSIDLSNLQVLDQSQARIAFLMISEQSRPDWTCIHRKLSTLLQAYNYCSIDYGHQDRFKLKATKTYFEKLPKRVGIRVLIRKLVNSDDRLIIYFPIDLKAKLKKTLNEFDRFQRHSLLFPMNHFINKEVKRELHKDFVTLLAQSYTQQLKSLPLKFPTILENVTIHQITASQVCPNLELWCCSQSEKKGIIGIQIEVTAFDYQLPKLYSLIELFFTNINYYVQILENTPAQSVAQDYLRQKYNNRKIKYISLSKQQVVIIGPPEYYSKVRVELSKHFWTISSDFYPNLNFGEIKTKENSFRRFLKTRQILWEDMLISQKSMTFMSDKANFEKIKHYVQIFLHDHLLEEVQITYITNSNDLSIFLKFTLEPLRASLLQDVQLSWQYGKAICRCPSKRSGNIKEMIRQLYDQHRQNLQTKVGLAKIEDPLVEIVVNPPDLVPEKYISRSLKAIEVDFELLLQDQALNRQEFVIVMVAKLQECTELSRLLGEQRASKIRINSHPLQEFVTLDTESFKSVVYCNVRGLHLWERSQALDIVYCKILRLIKSAKRQVAFLITGELLRYSVNKLQFMLKRLLDEQDQLYKRVKIILSSELAPQEKLEFINELRQYFKHQLREKITLTSQLQVDAIPEVLSLDYYRLTWASQQSDRKIQQLKCSPLNSFLFYSEREHLNYNNHRRFGIFLPKIPGLIELLVNLHSQQIFEVSGGEVTLVREGDLLKLVKETIAILRMYFQYQSNIVMYSNKEKTDIYASIYIYHKNCHRLQKCQIDMKERKIKETSSEPVSFDLQAVNVDRYRYRMHKDYLQTFRKKVTE